MATSSRKKTKIPDKAWLEALKFLIGPQWLKMRFVSRQLAEVVRENISELPRVIIDNVKFSQNSMAYRLNLKTTDIMASDILIPPNEKKDWFMKHGINFDAPTSHQLQSTIIGMEAKYGGQHSILFSYYADVSKLGKASTTARRKQKTVYRKLDENPKPKPVIFSGEFDPKRNEYSWPSTEYFLSLVYNPLTLIQKVEMDLLEIDKNLTDAFFLGEDYGSYIRCGTFTVKGNLSKSLSWIQRNVRANIISVPGGFNDVANSFQETSHFLLDNSWICANQIVKIEIIRDWKRFIATLIKQFRTTISTIEHAIPLIKFSFANFPDETFNLNYLAWDHEVIKLNSNDSLEAKYVISNGRNRMEIAVVKRRDVELRMSFDPNYFPSRRVFDEEPVPAIYDVTVKTYANNSAAPSQGKAPFREKVHIGNDTWLEALKFLTSRRWTKALFVSRQLAGVVQRNISRLPCIVIDSATMSESSSMSSDIVALDDIIAPNERNLFFTVLGISNSAPADVQHENAVIGLNIKKGYFKHRSIEMCLRGRAHYMQRYEKPIILSAQFNKLQKEHSWAALKYFLAFLYYPALYIKEIEMFALNQQLIDDFFEGEIRFLRCNAFTLKRETESPNMYQLLKSLSWLEKNVRANTIHFPEHIDYENENIYESLASFLLDESWKCARHEVNFKCVCNLDLFVKAILEKFRTISCVRKDVPMITASAYGSSEIFSFLLLDPNVEKIESQDPRVADVYIISKMKKEDQQKENQTQTAKDENRMQVEIFQKQEIHGYLSLSYAHRKYHNNLHTPDFFKFEVHINVNAI